MHAQTINAVYTTSSNLRRFRPAFKWQAPRVRCENRIQHVDGRRLQCFSGAIKLTPHCNDIERATYMIVKKTAAHHIAAAAWTVSLVPVSVYASLPGITPANKAHVRHEPPVSLAASPGQIIPTPAPDTPAYP